jgi:DNA (cytosine-5)-methyltransferase 1
MRDINTLPMPANYRWIGGKVADNFAGGGGASTGIAQGLGFSPDIAVNHNAEALMMHEQNHPTTKHYNESVWDINIPKALNNEPALMGWFSPDCTHFSVAKGGKPVKKAIRGLAWIVKKWVGQADMAMVFMENVKEFMTWGPLIAKRCKVTKRVIKLVADPVKKDKDGNPVMNEVVSEPGEQVRYWDQALVPDKKRAGQTFKQFVKQLREAGYQVEWREKGLNACDYGDPTTRNRFFLMARKDGLPIIWPEPTHASPKLIKANPGKLQPWKTAGENLDFSIPCPSIFDRKKPLAEKTLARIFKGIQKFVIGAGDDAFLVKVNHGGDMFRGQPLNEPIATLTSKHGTGLVDIAMVRDFSNVESQLTSAAAIMKFRGDSGGTSCNDPLPTITAGGGAARPAGAAHALGVLETTLEPLVMGCISTIDHQSTGDTSRGFDEPLSVVTSKNRHIQVAALLKHFTGVVGQTLDKPLPTITARDHNSVMECTLESIDPVQDLNDAIEVAHIQRDFGNSIGHSADEPLGAITAGGGGKSAVVASSLIKLKGTCKHGQPLDRPLDTIGAQGNHFAEVQAFLIKFYGTGGAVGCNEPLDTITSKARFGLVTIKGQDYQIVDIGMRMLEPHELYRCQGFPADYQHEVVMGKALPKHAQVRMVGNSVPPGLARALVSANIPRWALGREMQESA